MLDCIKLCKVKICSNILGFGYVFTHLHMPNEAQVLSFQLVQMNLKLEWNRLAVVVSYQRRR